MKTYSGKDSKGNPLDWKLAQIINKQSGFFIELGANDGLSFSNTAFFEFYRDFKGILIEPSITAFEKCKMNRPKSICLNYACVSNDYKNKYIFGDFNGNLMSSVNGLRSNRSNWKQNIKTIIRDIFKLLWPNWQIKVNALTLEKILDLYLGNNTIDLLSLDTEGYEYDVLLGLNLKKYRPYYMLIEVYNRDYDKIIHFLNENDYNLIENLTGYNKIDNPCWDGTCNDYLFMDKR